MPELVQGAVATRYGTMTTWRDGDGDRAIVLLHGLGGDHDQALGFTPAAAELAEHGRRWRRIAIDMRAHGATDAIGTADSLTFDAFAEDVEAVASRRSPPAASADRNRRHVDGRRGCAACRCALPGRGSGPRPHPTGLGRGSRPYQMLTPYQRLRESLAQSGPAGVEAFVETPEYQAILDQSPQAAQSLRRQFSRPFAVARAAVVTAIPTSEQLPIDTIRRLTIPTVVIASPNDPAHPLACAEQLAGAPHTLAAR